MTKRDRIMLSVIAVVAVVAAMGMLVIKPKHEEASSLAEQAEQAQQRRDTALASLANAKQAREKYAEATVGIARLGKAVPSKDDTATVVFQLERTARAAGIDFRSLTYESGNEDPTPTSGAGTGSPEGATTAVTKLPFKLTFRGRYFQLGRFVQHMASLTNMKDGKHVSVRGRLFTVDGISLVAGPGGFPDITANISATAYTAPAPTEGVPAGGANTAAAVGAGSETASGTTASATTETPTGVVDR